MAQYYDGTRLLSTKDINGKTPEIYIVETNRTGGKTTYFGRLFVNRFKDKRQKFMLLYRYKYELPDVAEKFFKDIGSLFFPSDKMSAKTRMSGTYYELFLNEESCGYAVALNSADQIKRNSHIFSDVERMLLDEMQSESGTYCADEVQKLMSIHTSVARGQGKQVRHVPVYMLSNAASLLNPYYVALGISSRLRDDTKILKGDGFVLERGVIKSAAEAQKESGFNRAFANMAYAKYSSENVYLNDNTAFIERPEGAGRYLATLKYGKKQFAIREYAEAGVIYCDDRPDETYPYKIVVSTDDHDVNYVMLKRNDLFLSNMRYFFDKGCFRFKDLSCKDAILNALSY